MTNKTWGGRFRKPMDRAVAHFNASLPFDHRLYSFDIEGSRVHARMLVRQGLIPEDEAGAMDRALAEIGQELEQVQERLKAVCEVLTALEKRHADDMVPGYTHLQQAQPVRLGQYFGAWGAMFNRDLGRLGGLEPAHEPVSARGRGTGGQFPASGLLLCGPRAWV